MDRSAWSGSDHDRPLTESGWRQALAIVAVLEDSPIVRFLASPTVRCADTLLPAAHGRGLVVEELPFLFESNEPESVAAAGRWLQELTAICLPGTTRAAAACTHGNILVPVLTWATGSAVERCPKGGVWRFDLNSRRELVAVEFAGVLNPRTGRWSR